MTKTCNRCNQEKQLIEFDVQKGGKLGCRRFCKQCRRVDYADNKDDRNAKRRTRHHERMATDPEYARHHTEVNQVSYQRNKGARKAYDQKNRSRTNQVRRQRYPKNRGKILASMKKDRKERGEQINARRRELRQLNLERQRAYEREYSRERRQRDLQYRIVGNLRNRIRLSLENKSECTKDLLGCSLSDFVKHLESQFYPEMTWANYGSYWSIDHIKACCSFDLTDSAQQKACFHWSNCRPLTVIENSRKGNTEDRLNKVQNANPTSFPCIPLTT